MTTLCATCDAGPTRRYCAPGRCYCAHSDCHAFLTYIDMSKVPLPQDNPKKTRKRSTWDDRKESTWIDQL